MGALFEKKKVKDVLPRKDHITLSQEIYAEIIGRFNCSRVKLNGTVPQVLKCVSTVDQYKPKKLRLHKCCCQLLFQVLIVK